MSFVLSRLFLTLVRICMCLSPLFDVSWTQGQGYPYDHFTRTPGSFLPGRNDRIMYHTGLEECLTACLRETNFLCKSIDMHNEGKCELSKFTAADAFGGLLGKNPDLTYFERSMDMPQQPVSTVTAAPVVNDCPTNITRPTEAGQAYATVTWSTPTISHEGSSLLEANHLPGTKFHLGDTKVVYTSSDSEGSTVMCDFFVIIKDEEIPSISHCPKPITKLTPGDNAQVSWEEPTVNDNSGSAWLSASHHPGNWFPVGNTTVIYKAQDRVGNRAELCSFVVHVTEIPDSNVMSLHLVLKNISHTDALQDATSKEYQKMVSKIEQDITRTFHDDKSFLGVTVQIRSSGNDTSADVKIGFSEAMSSQTEQHRLNVIMQAAHNKQLRNVSVAKLPQPDGNLQILDACFLSPCPAPMNCAAQGLQCVATCADNPAYCLNGGICQKKDTNYVTCKCRNDKLMFKYSGERCDSTRMALSVKQLSIVGIGGAWVLVLILTLIACIALVRQRRSLRGKCEITSPEDGHYLQTLSDRRGLVSPVSEDVGYSSRGEETSPNDNIMETSTRYVHAPQQGIDNRGSQSRKSIQTHSKSDDESPECSSVSSNSGFSDFRDKSTSDSGTEVIRFGHKEDSTTVLKQETASSAPTRAESQIAVHVDVERYPSKLTNLPCPYDGEIPAPVYENEMLVGQSVPEAKSEMMPHVTHSFGVIPDPVVKFNSGEAFPSVGSSQIDGGVGYSLSQIQAPYEQYY